MKAAEGRPSKALTLALSVLLFALAAFVLLHALLYFRQEQMIFYPQPLREEVRAAVHRALPDAEELSLPTPDGHRLRGWFVPNRAGAATARPMPALIYFGGNAEEVSARAMEAAELRGISFVLFDYRGYGLSTGEPGERALFDDALLIYDHVARLPQVDRTHIIVMGRSLGSGVATWLASRRAVAAVVLVTPYDSMAAVAHIHYPFLFTDLLLRHRFDSAARARAIDAPMLALIAERDTVIPPERGEALVRAWRGPAMSVMLRGAGHNDASLQPAYWPAIRAFLEKIGVRHRFDG